MRKITFVIFIVCLFASSCSSDEEAKMAADAYIASQKCAISERDICDKDDWLLANMDINANSNLSEEEKLQAQIELWDRSAFVKKGGNVDNICFVKNRPAYLYHHDELLKNLIDRGLDQSGRKYINEEFDKLEKAPFYQHAVSRGWCFPSDFKRNILAKAAAIYCLALNNKVISDAITWLSIKIPTARNQEEIMLLKKQYTDKFLTPAGDVVSLKEEKAMKLYVFKYYSYKQLLQLPTFYGLMNGMLNELFEEAVSQTKIQS